MAKEQFKSIRFSPETEALIDQLNEIIEEYQDQGLTMTLRQLYYQMIGRDLFPDSWIDAAYNAREGLPPDTKNTEKNYKKLGSILSDARLAGLVDWDAIEDRARQPVIWSSHESIDECVDEALAHYRLPRWRDQPKYVELWVEKDALANVLRPIAAKWHVTLMVNRGYSSSSAMYEAATRFKEACNTEGIAEKLVPLHKQLKEQGLAEGWEVREVNRRLGQAYKKMLDDGEGRSPVLLYLGDHDPSGEDMVRDIEERLKLFGVAGLTVEKVALTMQQVRRYNPPPNPAKVTDSRAKAYIAKHGKHSWEVDALNPTTLTTIIEQAIRPHVDQGVMARVKAQEEEDRELLKKAIENMRKKRK